MSEYEILSIMRIKSVAIQQMALRERNGQGNLVWGIACLFFMPHSHQQDTVLYSKALSLCSTGWVFLFTTVVK